MVKEERARPPVIMSDCGVSETAQQSFSISILLTRLDSNLSLSIVMEGVAAPLLVVYAPIRPPSPPYLVFVASSIKVSIYGLVKEVMKSGPPILK